MLKNVQNYSKIFHLPLFVLLCIGISGCLATVNLLEGDALDSGNKAIALKLAEMTAVTCTTYTYDPASGRDLSGRIKIEKLPEVKRLYKSESGWYKAELLVRGVWDNVYYLETKGTLVCGERMWQEMGRGSQIFFRQVG